jgi:hypothetical protein
MSKLAMVETAVTVTAVNYAEMTATALDEVIKSHNALCRALYSKLERNSETLYLALEEMERRFEKQQRYRTDLKPLKAQTWHGYIQSRGVQPAAYRQWKSRRNKALGASAAAVPVDINVRAAELARELEIASWAVKLAEIIKVKSKLNAVVTRRIVTALQDSSKQLAALAAQFGAGQVITLPVLGQCGGCSELHKGIVTLAEANPDWTDEQLAAKSHCSISTVNQALTRYCKLEAA